MIVKRLNILFKRGLVTLAERDPAPYFFNENVQQLLKKVTGCDTKKIFSPRMDGSKQSPPRYEFMTDEDLNKALEKAQKKADHLLQMPPVVKTRTEINKVLSKDTALEGHDTSKYVFTDITFGTKNSKRLIAVREPDGTLRLAKWSERSRMNQIYFPFEGRSYFTPKMFYGDNFQSLLKRQEYKFILDCACIQFEPDDPEYQRITKETYDYINSQKHYDTLRSTRHYGPFVFHLTWNKDIDHLLLENVTTGKIDDAVALIQLYHIIYPDSKSANEKYTGDNIKFISNYVDNDSVLKIKIKRALAAYIELEQQKQIVAENINRAHGYHTEKEIH